MEVVVKEAHTPTFSTPILATSKTVTFYRAWNKATQLTDKIKKKTYVLFCPSGNVPHSHFTSIARKVLLPMVGPTTQAHDASFASAA